MASTVSRPSSWFGMNWIETGIKCNTIVGIYATDMKELYAYIEAVICKN